MIWFRLALAPLVCCACIIHAEESVHEAVFKRYAAAVVGLNCRAGNMGYFGTGVVIAADGLILTSTTVIPPGATEVKAFFTDGAIRKGSLVEHDPKTESMLIHVDAKGLVFMPCADTDACKVGDGAYSWGNPFGTIQQDGAVSLAVGAISGIYQVASVDDQSRYRGPVIESDAAINPGSDGGPLTDHHGRLLGVISLAFSHQRWQGLVVPLNACRAGLPRLAKVPTAKAVPDSAADQKAWAVNRAMQAAAVDVAQSTVAVVVQYKDGSLPAKRADDKPLELPAIPRPRHAQAESAPPSPWFCSGFVVDRDGTIVTSATPFSLPDKPRSIHVYLPDGALAEARLLGKDTFYDIAALAPVQVKTRLPPVRLVSAKDLATGSRLAVLGRSEAPGDVTLNLGICSASGRYDGTCVQISCLLNYGNLGGPVVDLRGRVLGMANHLNDKTPWRQNCGVGFMLDAGVVQSLLADLKSGTTIAKPARPYLGVQSDYGAMDVTGARIAKVQEQGPARKAGLADGDVVVRFNGTQITDWLGLLPLLRACTVGQKAIVVVQRGKELLTFTVVIGQRE